MLFSRSSAGMRVTVDNCPKKKKGCLFRLFVLTNTGFYLLNKELLFKIYGGLFRLTVWILKVVLQLLLQLILQQLFRLLKIPLQPRLKFNR